MDRIDLLRPAQDHGAQAHALRRGHALAPEPRDRRSTRWTATREPFTGVIVGVRADEEGSPLEGALLLAARQRATSGTSAISRPSSGASTRPTSRRASTSASTRCSTGPSSTSGSTSGGRASRRSRSTTTRARASATARLGCYPCTTPVDSTATNLDEVIAELQDRQVRQHRRAQRSRPGQGRRRGSRDPPARGVHVAMQIVIAGHVDHGKSTVIGRLLADTGSPPRGQARAGPRELRAQLQAVRVRLPARRAEGRAVPGHHDRRRARLLQDADSATTSSSTRPGHIEFLKNMITGASHAEAALLVIDAKEGVQENSRRHGYMLSMLGISPDRRARQQDGPRRLRRGGLRGVVEPSTARSSQSLGVEPASRPARVGHGRATTSSPAPTPMPWFDGPTVLEALDGVRGGGARRRTSRFRMPVQDVYKFTRDGDDRRIVAGAIESGRSRVGRRGRLLPVGQAQPRARPSRASRARADPTRRRRRGRRLHARRADLRHARRDRRRGRASRAPRSARASA